MQIDRQSDETTNDPFGASERIVNQVSKDMEASVSGVAWRGVAWRGVAWRGEVQCSAVQCSAVQCSAVQCSAVRRSAVQCGPMVQKDITPLPKLTPSTSAEWRQPSTIATRK